MERADQAAKVRQAPTAALDIGRGLAIIAVIYGHALAPWFVDAGARFNELAFLQWKFGAAFMMPFFFFVSGIAWRARKSMSAALTEALALILLAFGASLVYLLVMLGLSSAGLAPLLAHTPLSVEAFFYLAWRSLSMGDIYGLTALWFLPALALTRFLAVFAARFGAWFGVLTIAVLFGVYLGSRALGWANIYQAQVLWACFAAFMAGHWLRRPFEYLSHRPRRALALAVLGFALTAATAGFNRGCTFEAARYCTFDFLNGHFGVSMFAGAFGFLPLFVFTAATGCLMAAASSVVLAHYGGFIAVFCKRLGRNALNLLVVNAIFLELVNPLIAREIVPRVGALTLVSFPILFAVALAANVAVAAGLRPALSRLRLGARAAAAAIVRLLSASAPGARPPAAGASSPA